MNSILKIGKWDVYPLETGTFRLDGGAMMGSVPKVLWEKTNSADKLNRINLAMRCLLLDDGENRVVIETGIGNKNSDKFIDNFHIKQGIATLSNTLSNVGYSIADITDVIITHLHFDHSGGATSIDENGELIPTFPNAKYWISETNWNHANNPNPKDRASYLNENFLPLKDAGVLNLIPDNSDIMNGISTIGVNGHTVGQQLIKINSMNETLVFCGDLIPIRSHLRLPYIMGYDLSAIQTLQEKTEFLNQASKGNWWLWFYHDPQTIMVQISEGEKHYKVINEVRKDRQ
ncbi:MAG: MBL fold metallo-hydrolase [Candidatus Marinimicrobia bacterium]|nr:MBL fold metallo-hydrolase [Candidatus Neomarinimicrobiota bacterium]MBL7023772.1 MBL fold metallo-hydrolase [Candidatus Neomarinimicrobiota bacterium]MBL7110097.1 MBL fold metallo-hydrolase [Candidatus Neomarinimicrobiota bacterium]